MLVNPQLVPVGRSWDIDSRADAITLNIPLVIQTVETAGYYAFGDGGGALYKRVAVQPTHAGKFQSNDGAWWEIASPSISVRMFGAKGDNVNDDTSAFQNAITYVDEFGFVAIPTGTYKITSQVTIAKGRVALIGEGAGSLINFVPTADATCFHFENGNQVIFQNEISNLAFMSTDVTYSKTAIKFVDSSQATISNIVTVSPAWYGGATGSIFLHLAGREAFSINNLNVYADKCIRVSPIPAPHVANGIGLDGSAFTNCYLVGNNYPIITVDSGVVLSSIVFEGRQNWVQGTAGFYFNDALTVGQSINVAFFGVRWEQTQDVNGHMFYIAPNTGLTGLVIEGCYAGVTHRGPYLRKCENVRLADSTFATATIGCDIDNTNKLVCVDNVTFTNPAVTVTLNSYSNSGQYKIGGNVFSLQPNVAAGAGMQQSWNPSATLGFSQLTPKTFTCPASSTITFANNTIRGVAMVFADGGVSAIINFPNGAAPKILTQSDAGWFGVAAGSANYNFYWDAGSSTYKFQCNIASPATIYFLLMGRPEQA